MKNIKEMVEKYLPSNQEAIKCNEYLKLVDELCTEIDSHYQMRTYKTSQGTIYGKYGYNVHFTAEQTHTDLYFRVENFGIEFNNDRVIYEKIDESLVEKVIDYCTKYFKRKI
jgi:hypothetical protein